jgi:hypothetical protein
MSNLVEHAKRELELAGVEEDVRPSLIGAVEAFASYGHSGGSAAVCTDILGRLLRFQNLAPIGTTPDEWMNVSDMAGEEMWQNTRRSSTFSHDGGKTWYDIEDPRLNNGDRWHGHKGLRNRFRLLRRRLAAVR